jgi:hypothetical protein
MGNEWNRVAEKERKRLCSLLAFFHSPKVARSCVLVVSFPSSGLRNVSLSLFPLCSHAHWLVHNGAPTLATLSTPPCPLSPIMAMRAYFVVNEWPSQACPVTWRHEDDGTRAKRGATQPFGVPRPCSAALCTTSQRVALSGRAKHATREARISGVLYKITIVNFAFSHRLRCS